MDNYWKKSADYEPVNSYGYSANIATQRSLNSLMPLAGWRDSSSTIIAKGEIANYRASTVLSTVSSAVVDFSVTYVKTDGGNPHSM